MRVDGWLGMLVPLLAGWKLDGSTTGIVWLKSRIAERDAKLLSQMLLSEPDTAPVTCLLLLLLCECIMSTVRGG